ncbi:13639_t:CDS:1, partial [Dentiscutata heterogama]
IAELGRIDKRQHANSLKFGAVFSKVCQYLSRNFVKLGFLTDDAEMVSFDL